MFNFIVAPRKAAFFFSAALITASTIVGQCPAIADPPPTSVTITGIHQNATSPAYRGEEVAAATRTVAGVPCDVALGAACVNVFGDLGVRSVHVGSSTQHHGLRRLFDATRYAFGERWIADVACAKVLAADKKGRALVCAGRSGELAVSGGVYTHAWPQQQDCDVKRIAPANRPAVACIDHAGNLRLDGDLYVEGR